MNLKNIIDKAERIWNSHESTAEAYFTTVDFLQDNGVHTITIPSVLECFPPKQNKQTQNYTGTVTRQRAQSATVTVEASSYEEATNLIKKQLADPEKCDSMEWHDIEPIWVNYTLVDLDKDSGVA